MLEGGRTEQMIGRDAGAGSPASGTASLVAGGTDSPRHEVAVQLLNCLGVNSGGASSEESY